MKIFYVFIFLLLSVANGFAQTLENDRLALIDLYYAAGGSGWYISTGWNVPGSPGDNPCGWYGVTCENGRVTEVEFPSLEIIAPMPSSIGNLTALKSLVLEGSGPEFGHLEGIIPAVFTNLINLEKLNLSGNVLLNIEIISSLTKLKYLSITPPRGAFPVQLSNLINLEHLYLTNYDVFGPRDWGSIPTFFGNFSQLKTLSIEDLNITGPIPVELGKLANLETLLIRPVSHYSNGGSSFLIPVSLGNLTKLKSLTISNGVIFGAIPADLGNLSNLEILDLSNNKLTGPIPASIGQLTNIQTLNLSNNLLSGTIPSLSGITVAAKVYLNNNAFTFSGMEANISKLDTYGSQAKIPVYVEYPLRTLASSPGLMRVNAGGTTSNNTYKWYKNNVLVSTAVGNNYYYANQLGTYRVQVSNSLVPGLVLVSQNYLVDVIMPVSLSNFSAKKQSSGNFLTWQTTSETTNKGFEIERSKDAINFENIGFIDGNGDSKANKDYSFLDKNPFPLTYYRLKQIDYDGKLEYSRIIYVKKDEAKLSFYPNPVKGELFISGLEKEENVTIHSLEGRLILNQKLLPSQSINTSNFSNGLYVLKVGGESRKVVIQN